MQRGAGYWDVVKTSDVESRGVERWRNLFRAAKVDGVEGGFVGEDTAIGTGPENRTAGLGAEGEGT